MAKYTALTKLRPSEVIERAVKHFGALSGGVQTRSRTNDTLCLESPDGYVTLSVCPAEGKKNRLDIETAQFDSQVREFLRTL
jgi:hypothetical protein